MINTIGYYPGSVIAVPGICLGGKFGIHCADKLAADKFVVSVLINYFLSRIVTRTFISFFYCWFYEHQEGSIGRVGRGILIDLKCGKISGVSSLTKKYLRGQFLSGYCSASI
jgi:hypothetical protein